MPSYDWLRRVELPQRIRILDGLDRLRDRLALDGLGDRTLDHRMRIATWNIREFDSSNYGLRTLDAYAYIAEIISRFDIVAVQEVRRNLKALKTLMGKLGPTWDYLVTDTTDGDAGNDERLAYVFDTRKVRPSGLVGEVVIPPKRGEFTSFQLARTPFTAGFQCGWAKFQLTTVHLIWDDDSDNVQRRQDEARALGKALAAKARSLGETDDNLVLLGDFNVFNADSPTLAALLESGWEVPPQIQALPGSNLTGNRKYDQIALWPQRNRFELAGAAGVFDYTKAVFRSADEALYPPEERVKVSGAGSYAYSGWRTHQMSDHLPMWIEVDINHSAAYLDELRNPV